MNRNDTGFMVQKIRTQYMEKDSSEKNIDLLRELDKKVKLPANVFGYVFGRQSVISKSQKQKRELQKQTNGFPKPDNKKYRAYFNSQHGFLIS